MSSPLPQPLPRGGCPGLPLGWAGGVQRPPLGPKEGAFSSSAPPPPQPGLSWDLPSEGRGWGESFLVFRFSSPPPSLSQGRPLSWGGSTLPISSAPLAPLLPASLAQPSPIEESLPRPSSKSVPAARWGGRSRQVLPSPLPYKLQHCGGKGQKFGGLIWTRGQAPPPSFPSAAALQCGGLAQAECLPGFPGAQTRCPPCSPLPTGLAGTAGPLMAGGGEGSSSIPPSSLPFHTSSLQQHLAIRE